MWGIMGGLIGSQVHPDSPGISGAWVSQETRGEVEVEVPTTPMLGPEDVF